MVLQLLKKKQKKDLFYFVLAIAGSTMLTTVNIDATKNAKMLRETDSFKTIHNNKMY